MPRASDAAGPAVNGSPQSGPRPRSTAVGAENRARDFAAAGADQSRQADDLAFAHVEVDVARRRSRRAGPRTSSTISPAVSQNCGAGTRRSRSRPTIMRTSWSGVTSPRSSSPRVARRAAPSCGRRARRPPPSGARCRRWPRHRLRAAGSVANSASVSRSDSAAVGSSITRMRACCDSALAISTICCCATPSLWTGIARSMSKPSPSCRARARASAMHPGAVDQCRGTRPARLAAEKDVLRDIEVGNEREFLEDHGDAEPPRVGGRRDVDRSRPCRLNRRCRRGRRRRAP